ncbi:MAG: alpha/beta fold hydrolase [Pseudomonadota bacterium]
MTLELTTIQHLAAESEVATPLLIAHGLFGSARNFNTLGRGFATDRNVILVDMRNHGDSPWDDDISYQAMAEDLAQAAIQHAGGKAVILGHSMGGKAAMALALSHPELVHGLIVADIAPQAYEHTHLSYVQAMRAMDLSAIQRRSQADPMLADAVSEPAIRSFILQNLVMEDGKARWRLNLAALEAGMDDLVGWPEQMDAKAFGGPTLFLHGGASDYLPEAIKPHAQMLFPNADFFAIPGAGHWLHAENPAAFQAAVRDFLSAI